jgi:asparagine synthase (glutamine-hydrolysing)
MAHRGPDGAGLWASPDRKCVFGHRRLSIIDLSESANQPMLNSEKSVALIFNGEIYNHSEVRKELEKLGKYKWITDHSDTEVLLHAYEQWGLDCIHRFCGMFAFAIYDARNPTRPVLHLVRDRVGIKPLYLTRTGAGEWLFGSEIRALLAHPDVTAEMDRTAFWHYLTFIVTPAPLTLFRGIFKIPAGYAVSIDHTGRAQAHSYWDCRPNANETFRETDLSEQEAESELTRLLKQSIRRRMVSDVPFGVLLSGGVDSSLNVALMSELMDRPVTTFTIGYEGEAATNEFQFARQVSRQYKTTHHETLIDHRQAQDFLPLMVRLQDEPIADNVCIPLYFLAKLVKDSGTTVVQVGEGSDENFLGYWWCEHYRHKAETIYDPALAETASPFRRLLASAKTRLGPGFSEDGEIQQRARSGQELFWGGAACWWGQLRESLTPDRSPFAGPPPECPVEGLLFEDHRTLESHDVVRHYLGGLSGILQKIPYMEMKLRIPEHLLMRVDKLTMAHSVEARVPFLDHDLVEFAMRLPASYKLRDGVGKYILKKVASRYFGDEIVYRKKQGFGAPMERWFKEGEFGKRCIAAFERSQIRKQGFLDNDFFLNMLKKQTTTGSGYSFQIWTVLNAVLWHESWIEGREDCL